MKNILRIVFAALALAAVTTNAQRVTTIRQNDFDNFRYSWSEPGENVPETWHWIASPPDSHFTTVNGIHHFYDREQDKDEGRLAPRIIVNSVTYGDVDGDGVDEALVALNYSPGGTGNWDYLYVYKLQDGRAHVIARLQAGSRGSGGLIRAFVQENLLVADFADSERLSGDCCSEGYIRVRYRWREDGFVEEGTVERGDLELQAGPPRPQFRDYPARNIYHGKPAAPIITSEFRMFRTRIRRGAKSEVQFAGHYTIPRWGCGTECINFVIVDSKRGKVYDGFGVQELPFTWLEKHGGDAIERMEFHVNSRLLKINACPNEENCGLYDYEMIDGKGLKLIRKELLTKEAMLPPCLNEEK
jgi:hypothetical protein